MDKAVSQYLVNMPRVAKRALMLATDALLIFATVQISFFLRLGYWEPVVGRPYYATIAAIAFALPLFITNGLYRAIFRYSGAAAIRSIARSCVLFAIPFVAIFTFIGVAGVPRTVGIIEPILLFLAVAGLRTLADWWLGATYRNRFVDRDCPRAVIYGVGDAARQLHSAITESRAMRIVGFVDDHHGLGRATLAGIPIYRMEELDRLAADGLVDEALLAAPDLTRGKRLELVEHLTAAGLHVRMLPAMTDIVRGKVSIADLKDVAIEDLLSRRPVPPDEQLLEEAVRGRTVLVTGAGGSIGSELCRQIHGLGPRRLILVESSEFNLYSIDSELRAAQGDGDTAVELVPRLGSVRDRRRMEEIFRIERPETIYHAAAYKHVPLVEANPKEALDNNVLGTATMVDLASRYDAQYFILISSDKAVRPTNVMGATKRMAELVVQAYAASHPGRRFCMVRFGNVLGSSGSVVPKFRQQIADGGPVTLTHMEMTRYFMTIPEAAQLVIQAGSMARGGEVFVLDMGEPVKISDLARNMIRLSGLTVRDEDEPDGDIEIQVVGIREGEKLYEELLIGDNPEPSSHPRIMKAHEAQLSWREINAALDELRAALNADDDGRAIAILSRTVPEYSPREQLAGLSKTTGAPADGLRLSA